MRSSIVRGMVVIGVVVAVALLAACNTGDCITCASGDVGSGRLATEARSVEGFSAIGVHGAVAVTVEHTGYESLEITAEDNILPLLESEVRGGRLFLGPVSGAPISTTLPIEYHLTVRTLDDIEVSGASAVVVPDLDNEHLRVVISGASAMTLAGRADLEEVAVSGASSYAAPDLSSRITTVDVSGASAAAVRTSEELGGSVSGSSVLEYLGEPALSLTVTGNSILRHLDGR
ncbi:MAG: DUF2807 domain-containing protein [Acidobacteria bacterium]|nr:DUF2807 domain-containing protein [Acidobacteriota bacterium]